jgi:hypothetical protein
MEFLNLTPHTVEVMENDGGLIKTVSPSGKVGLAAGEPPAIVNVPPPRSGMVYIVLPAVSDASDRNDLVSIDLEKAHRSHRGNVRSHVCVLPD